MAKSLTGAQRRTFRTRNKIKRINRTDRPRLSVFRSNNHITAQVIDDVKGVTVAAASTLDKDVREKVKSGSTVAASEEVGKIIAERAKAAGIDKVVFDRGSAIFHGRVKAVAEGARAGGLEF